MKATRTSELFQTMVAYQGQGNAMPFSIEWDTEKKLGIRITASGNYTWDDIWAMHKQVRIMIDSVDHLVALYFLNGEYVSRNIPAGLITHGRTLYMDRHPRNHVTCYVNPNPSMISSMWYQLMEKTVPSAMSYFRLVTSLEAARKVAAEVAQQSEQQMESAGN